LTEDTRPIDPGEKQPNPAPAGSDTDPLQASPAPAGSGPGEPQASKPSINPDTAPRRPALIPGSPRSLRFRFRFGMVLAVVGILVFLLGIRPGWIGLDRSPVVGFVQIAVFLVGLALVSLGGYMALVTGWGDRPLSLTAEIGARLISTGYVIAVASGMADVFGFGSEPLPRIPDYGIWQQRGVVVGIIVIGAGFVLLLPWKKR